MLIVFTACYVCQSSIMKTENTLCIPCINHYNKGNHSFTWNGEDGGVKISKVTTNKLAYNLPSERAEKRYHYVHVIILSLFWMGWLVSMHTKYKYLHTHHSEKSTHTLDITPIICLPICLSLIYPWSKLSDLAPSNPYPKSVKSHLLQFPFPILL